MNVPQIRMESQFARIGIETMNAELEMEQPHAEMSIEQPKADLDMERIPGRLTIDQTSAWEAMELKSVFKRIEEHAQLGYEGWLEGTARISQQGDELMRIENDGDPIVSQAIENSEQPPYEFNVGWIPEPFSVKIRYEPGEIQIRARANAPVIDIKPNQPVYRFTPGNVNIYLAQRNKLEISIVNEKT